MAETTCPDCGAALPKPDTADAPLMLGGELYELDKLSFRERKAIRRVMRELVLLDDPKADPEEDWNGDDARLAFAIICARRTNPGYTLQAGLELTPDELKAPTSTGNVAGDGPPTPPAAGASSTT